MEKWFKDNGNISPITNKPLNSIKFIPNLAIKSQIDEYNDKKATAMKKKFTKSFVSVASNVNTSNAIKLLLIGDCGVGKTSIKKYIEFSSCDSTFIQPTIGIESCVVKYTQMRGKKCKDNNNIIVRITDICGQDRFRSLTRQCYRGIHGVVLICSLDCPDSVKSLKTKWSDDVFEYAPDNIYGAVIVNKVDLLYSSSKDDQIFANSHKKSQYESLMRQAISFANFIGYPVYNCSALTGEYIHAAFSEIVHRIINDSLMWDTIQYNNNYEGVRTTTLPLTIVPESACGQHGCLWAIKGIGSFAENTFEKIKNKLDDNSNEKDI